MSSVFKWQLVFSPLILMPVRKDLLFWALPSIGEVQVQLQTGTVGVTDHYCRGDISWQYFLAETTVSMVLCVELGVVKNNELRGLAFYQSSQLVMPRSSTELYLWKQQNCSPHRSMSLQINEYLPRLLNDICGVKQQDHHPDTKVFMELSCFFYWSWLILLNRCFKFKSACSSWKLQS